MADVIALTGLRVFGHHGVFDFERREGQDFVVDVELELDTSPAAASDDVTDTVHYGELAEALAAVVGGERGAFQVFDVGQVAQDHAAHPPAATWLPADAGRRERRALGLHAKAMRCWMGIGAGSIVIVWKR